MGFRSFLPQAPPQARPLLLVSALAAATLVACTTVKETVTDAVDAPPPEEYGLWEDAAGTVADRALATLCTDYWEHILATDPISATYLGDSRHLDTWPRNSERAQDNLVEKLERLQGRVNDIDPARLSAGDRLTHELLAWRIADELAVLEAGLDGWTIDPLEGPVTTFLNLTAVQPTDTPGQRESLVKRWSGFAGYLRVAASNLRRSAVEGRISSTSAFDKQLGQVASFLDTPPMDSPLVTLATGGGRWVPLPRDGSVARIAHEELGDARLQRDLRLINLHLQDGERLVTGTRVLLPAADDPLSPEERGEFLNAVLNAVEYEIYPAVASYRDTLDTLAAGARDDGRPGLVHVPGGEEAYLTMVAHHTSLPPVECDPAAIHAFGLSEVARIRGQMADLGERVFGTRDVPTIQRRLRSDASMHFTSRGEVEAKAREALARAESKMDAFFGIQPKAPCIVLPVPSHSEVDTTIAYYEGPEPGGGRPGIYFVNTYAPTTRTRYEAEVLAYHEAIPGHHLQIAIAQELEHLPLFRRHGGSTAFVEGWALYTERLSDEMGLYSGDVDRLGVLSYDAWRACRLVVDTGIHAFGWSREEAVEYMVANTLLAPNNVENEVDRYIAWPGQALAYKIGQREILELRDLARETLGGGFSYPDFHDRVLAEGAVTLSALRRRVSDWLGVAPEPTAATAVEAGAGGGR